MKDIYDYQASVKLLGGREEAAKEILALFIQEVPGMMQQLEQAVNQGDAEQLTELLHKFKGGLAYCIAPRVSQIVQQFSQDVKLLKNAEYPKHYQNLQVELEMFVAFVKEKNFLTS